MIFDVIIREGFNVSGKQIINVYRVHDAVLSKSLRDVQSNGKFIISVIPLFRKKEERKREKEVLKDEEGQPPYDPIDPDVMIDPHGF